VSTAENVIGFCKDKLNMELTEYDEFNITRLFERLDRRREGARETLEIRKRDGVINAFEEAAKLEPEWKHVPGYAEFEVNRAGDVRNALTKLPLKALGTGTKKQAFMLRADNGIKRMIYKDWIVKQAFPN